MSSTSYLHLFLRMYQFFFLNQFLSQCPFFHFHYHHHLFKFESLPNYSNRCSCGFRCVFLQLHHTQSDRSSFHQVSCSKCYNGLPKNFKIYLSYIWYSKPHTLPPLEYFYHFILYIWNWQNCSLIFIPTKETLLHRSTNEIWKICLLTWLFKGPYI